MKKHGMTYKKGHVLFWGGVFSQWYQSPFIANSIRFDNAEQWMMWNKAVLFGDKEAAEKILRTSDPKRIKAIGRAVKNFDTKKWNAAAFDIVVEGSFHKFSQDTGLMDILVETGDDILVEASPYDNIWGVGMHSDDPDIFDQKKWKGTNLLGKALMVTRAKLRNEPWEKFV